MARVLRRCAARLGTALSLPFIAVVVSGLALMLGEGSPQAQGQGAYLAAWTGDEDRADSDFLAVVNVDASSPDYGQIVATVPVGERATNPRHSEHAFTPGHPLFVSGFAGNRMFRFDLSDPLQPRLLGTVEGPSRLTFSHSLERLPNGNVLVTMQANTDDLEGSGGMAEFRDDGSIAQWASAQPVDVDGLVRPYSLAVVPEKDRVVTASNVMTLPTWHPKQETLRNEPPLSHVQLWQLSDLSLLKTLALPAVAGSDAHERPNEPRVLGDGETVLVSTSRCRLWRLSGLERESFAAELVYAFDAGGCAVPLSIGRYWVQSVGGSRRVVVLDLSNPSHPVEVSHVQFNEQQRPHWLAFDEGTSRIVMVNSPGPTTSRRMWMLNFDVSSGQLTLDERFRDAGADEPGVDFDREAWPHGATGEAIPHGSVFLN